MKIRITERFNPAEGFIQSDEGITLLPANLELSAMEMSLVSTMNRERILKGYLDRVKNNFDFVVIDCMPSLGMITINALSASRALSFRFSPITFLQKAWSSC